MLVSTAFVVALPASVQMTGPWSAPATLAACSAPGAPAIAFPSDEPQHGTGPGAIVWASGGRCAGPSGARVAAMALNDDTPGPAAAPRTPGGDPLALAGPLAVAPAPHGMILLAGATIANDRSGATIANDRLGTALAGDRSETTIANDRPGAAIANDRPEPAQSARVSSGGQAGRSAEPGLLFGEGPVGGTFSEPQSSGGPATPLAVTSAYLGDVALASPGAPGKRAGPGGAIELRIHRYYASAFGPPVPVTDARGVQGLTLAMDYRSDALVAWERDGTIWARLMPGSDRTADPSRRVAAAAAGARIAAVLSDDNRAILAWSETRRQVTSVWYELSGTGVRFGAPHLLERFADHAGPQGGGPRLVRLASESVMLAWTGAVDGHPAVRAAAIDLNGVKTIQTISEPGRDAVLADLAPGPDDEAYALWSEPQAGSAGAGGGSAQGGEALYAARGIDTYPDHTIFGAPEQIAATGPSGTNGEATIGVDPDSDRAIAAWRTSDGTIDYSLRAVG